MRKLFGERRVWRLCLSGHWFCVNHLEDLNLADYLAKHGFYIPESIDYCLAQNDSFTLKYRVFGGQIITYINSKK